MLHLPQPEKDIGLLANTPWGRAAHLCKKNVSTTRPSLLGTYPPPFAHARPCLSTGWALNRRFEEILGPLCSWSRKEGLGVCRALVQGKRGSVMFVMVHSLHNNIVPHIATPCCLF